MAGGLARIVVLTALLLSLIFSALLAYVHNRLYDKDLQRALDVESGALRRLMAPLRADRPEPQPPVDATLKHLLGFHAFVRVREARLDTAFYEEPEIQAFLVAQVHGQLKRSTTGPPPSPPVSTSVQSEPGAVVVRWDPGPRNRLLAGTLARQGSDPQLAFRIYKGVNGPASRPVATVPFGVDQWRDTDLPLARARLSYQVWAIVLRSGPQGEVLMEAEPGDMVTVATPEHFHLWLVGGDPEQARFRVEVSLASETLGSAMVSVRASETITVGGMSTGLVVQSIEAVPEDRLTTKNQIVLTTDGSIVLDPHTRQPRTTQTQVLVRVTRLVAVLADPIGELRTMEVDLP